MRIDAISIGRNPPDEVNVIVEVPVGGEPIKYEMDKEAGTLIVDRFLYTSMRYPGNYGFIPHTLSEDGDPCDVLIANQRGIIPGAIVACRPVGVLMMQDEAGGDEKIVAVPVSRLTRRYENVHDIKDLPEITLKQIEHFFSHYKDLESNKWVKVIGWGDAADARRLILEAIERATRAKDGGKAKAGGKAAKARSEKAKSAKAKTEKTKSAKARSAETKTVETKAAGAKLSAKAAGRPKSDKR